MTQSQEQSFVVSASSDDPHPPEKMLYVIITDEQWNALF